MKKLNVLFMDGYETTFDLKEGSVVKYEANYIFLVTANEGNRFIPMCNVRWFSEI